MKHVPDSFLEKKIHYMKCYFFLKTFILTKISGENAVLELRNDVLAVAEGNPDSHIFMDEVPIGPLGLEPDFIKHLGDFLKGNFLWIACKKNSSLDDPNQIQRNLNSFLILG